MLSRGPKMSKNLTTWFMHTPPLPSQTKFFQQMIQFYIFFCKFQLPSPFVDHQYINLKVVCVYMYICYLLHQFFMDFYKVKISGIYMKLPGFMMKKIQKYPESGQKSVFLQLMLWLWLSMKGCVSFICNLPFFTNTHNYRVTNIKLCFLK